MFTTDLALKEDPEYRKIAKRFQENPEEYQLAFAKAWYKLTHRDMGPRSRYVGSEIPGEELIWQDPVPPVDHALIDSRDARRLKSDILDTGLSVSELVRTAWAAAGSYRDSDMRGGTNGGRLALAPQKDWAVNDPAVTAKVIDRLQEIQRDFNRRARGGKKVSLADMIVLGGAAAIEKAAKDAGHSVEVPFAPGRTDATQAMTDVASFSVLEPKADGFRNYYTDGALREPAAALVDRADQLALTVPEMTVLVGGLRALGANTGGAKHGVLTSRPGTLNNDFFLNLLDMSNKWTPAKNGVYEGRDRSTGEVKWTATEVDLVFGSNAELRAVAEVYAFNGAEKKFVEDFVDAWTKVMNLGRFDTTANPVAM
jgi:catalase-peroxidase